MSRLIWEDENGEIELDEERMADWFTMAVHNIQHYDIPEDETAWMLFLMGAESAIRGNKGESPHETGES